MKQIKDLRENDKPREKLLSKGAQALSNRELIALILGSGSKNNPLMSISKTIENMLENQQLEALSIEKLSAVPGVGNSKACQILAAFELAKRFYIESEKPLIKKTCDILPLLKEYAEKKQEYFFTITLDGSKRVIDVHLTFIGTLNYALLHPREVFAVAITDRAASIIVAHNHPSGDPNPSYDDKVITQQLRDTGILMGIELSDHIIFTKKNRYYSFLAHGIL
jgi:DNA repair protein RadC